MVGISLARMAGAMELPAFPAALTQGMKIGLFSVPVAQLSPRGSSVCSSRQTQGLVLHLSPMAVERTGWDGMGWGRVGWDGTPPALLEVKLTHDLQVV